MNPRQLRARQLRARPDRAEPPGGGRDLAPELVEALTVAMVLAPGVYARNRMFELFTAPGARKARTRASLVRGIAVDLARAEDISLAPARDGGVVLRYAIASVQLRRVVVLAATELAALRLIAARAKLQALPEEPSDRPLVVRALGRLMTGNGSSDVVRFVEEHSPKT